MTNNLNYHNLIVPTSIGITCDNGSDFNIQICHNLIKDSDDRYGTTGIFSLYLDNFGLDKNDFEDLSGEDIYDLSDERNPDYLGRILFDEKGHWIYDGDQLVINEQEQIAGFINSNEDGDVYY